MTSALQKAFDKTTFWKAFEKSWFTPASDGACDPPDQAANVAVMQASHALQNQICKAPRQKARPIKFVDDKTALFSSSVKNNTCKSVC